MLQGIWLVATVIAAFVAGVFVSSQTLKDFFKGVPGEVRTAFKGLEARVLASHKAALDKAAADAAKALEPIMPTPPQNPQA